MTARISSGFSYIYLAVKHKIKHSGPRQIDRLFVVDIQSVLAVRSTATQCTYIEVEEGRICGWWIEEIVLTREVNMGDKRAEDET